MMRDELSHSKCKHQSFSSSHREYFFSLWTSVVRQQTQRWPLHVVGRTQHQKQRNLRLNKNKIKFSFLSLSLQLTTWQHNFPRLSNCSKRLLRASKSISVQSLRLLRVLQAASIWSESILTTVTVSCCQWSNPFCYHIRASEINAIDLPGSSHGDDDCWQKERHSESMQHQNFVRGSWWTEANSFRSGKSLSWNAQVSEFNLNSPKHEWYRFEMNQRIWSFARRNCFPRSVGGGWNSNFSSAPPRMLRVPEGTFEFLGAGGKVWIYVNNCLR